MSYSHMSAQLKVMREMIQASPDTQFTVVYHPDCSPPPNFSECTFATSASVQPFHALLVDDLRGNESLFAAMNARWVERSYPLEGKVQLIAGLTFAIDSDNIPVPPEHDEPNRIVTTDVNVAQAATSQSVSDPTMHYPVFDVDLPIQLVPSTTEGHFHVYIDHPIRLKPYLKLLDALAEAGIVQKGYVASTRHRGFSCVRLPWIKKVQP